MDPKMLTFQFGVGAFVLERNLAGVTHEESLESSGSSANTLNWILGHIVRTRTQALRLLGGNPPFDESDLGVYAADDFLPSQALSLEELKKRFDILGPELASQLEKCSPEQLATPAPLSPTGDPDETIGSLLASIAFHEAYHLGQTGILRRFLGKPGAIRSPR